MALTPEPSLPTRPRDDDERTEPLSELNSSIFNDPTIAHADQDPENELDEIGHRKRRKTAPNIWSYARELRPGELERGDSGQLLWYCARCDECCTSLTTARRHMKRKHHITVVEDTPNVL